MLQNWLAGVGGYGYRTEFFLCVEFTVGFEDYHLLPNYVNQQMIRVPSMYNSALSRIRTVVCAKAI